MSFQALWLLLKAGAQQLGVHAVTAEVWVRVHAAVIRNGPYHIMMALCNIKFALPSPASFTLQTVMDIRTNNKNALTRGPATQALSQTRCRSATRALL